MEQATLMVHRGATRVTRDELATIEAPPATATWKPIPHAALVGAIHEELGRREITVAKEEYAVQRKNNMLFGVMTLNWMQTDEFAAALAFRHANDMSEAVKMYAGVRVFNCDNMTLSGDEIILKKKHSPRFNLAAALPEAFDRYQNGALQLQRDINDIKQVICSQHGGKRYIYDIFRHKIVPLRLFYPVSDSWHAAAPDSNNPSNHWTLYNCFTEHIKKLPPGPGMRATVRLGRFFGLGAKAHLEQSSMGRRDA